MPVNTCQGRGPGLSGDLIANSGKAAVILAMSNRPASLVVLRFFTCVLPPSGPSPEPEQRAAWANSGIGIGKDQMGHSLSHGGRRCLSADVPSLVGRIGSDDQEV
jgi:hypothetical protein